MEGSAALMPRLLPHLDETIDHYLMPVHCTFAPICSNQMNRLILMSTALIRFSPTIWCSAACPTGTKALFAVGTSDGLHTLEGSGDHWTLSQKPLPNEANTGHQGFRRHGDSSDACVKAVEWLTSDLIASGLRNSTVFLHDLRSGGSAVRLQHPHSVDKIRKVDPYRLVVGGYNSVILSLLTDQISSAIGHAVTKLKSSSKCMTSALLRMVSSRNRTQFPALMIPLVHT